MFGSPTHSAETLGNDSKNTTKGLRLWLGVRTPRIPIQMSICAMWQNRNGTEATHPHPMVPEVPLPMVYRTPSETPCQSPDSWELLADTQCTNTRTSTHAQPHSHMYRVHKHISFFILTANTLLRCLKHLESRHCNGACGVLWGSGEFQVTTFLLY